MQILTSVISTFFYYQGATNYAAVGASGAVVGVVFGYCMLRPWSLIYFFLVLPVPAVVFALLFVIGTVWAIRKHVLPGIAHDGHLGGAIGGVIMMLLLEPGIMPSLLRQLGA